MWEPPAAAAAAPLPPGIAHGGRMALVHVVHGRETRRGRVGGVTLGQTITTEVVVAAGGLREVRPAGFAHVVIRLPGKRSRDYQETRIRLYLIKMGSTFLCMGRIEVLKINLK